jgi:hypothetical protein
LFFLIVLTTKTRQPQSANLHSYDGKRRKARRKAQNMQSTLQQLQNQVGKILNSKQHFVKAEVSQRLDELLSMGVAKFDQKTETKLDQAKTKLVDLEVKTNAILGSAGIAIPNAEAEAVAATVRSSITPRQDMKDQRDELLSHFG